MPRSKNPSMYPSFFHDVARRAMIAPIRVPGGQGDAGKKKAEKYRWHYYGFRTALEKYHQTDQHAIACGIAVLLRYDIDTKGIKHWYILFQNREEDPFFDDFKAAMEEIGEPESAALPPEGESYQFEPIDTDDLRTDPLLQKANEVLAQRPAAPADSIVEPPPVQEPISEPQAVAKKELERFDPPVIKEMQPPGKPAPKGMRYKT